MWLAVLPPCGRAERSGTGRRRQRPDAPTVPGRVNCQPRLGSRKATAAWHTRPAAMIDRVSSPQSRCGDRPCHSGSILLEPARILSRGSDPARSGYWIERRSTSSPVHPEKSAKISQIDPAASCTHPRSMALRAAQKPARLGPPRCFGYGLRRHKGYRAIRRQTAW